MIKSPSLYIIKVPGLSAAFLFLKNRKVALIRISFFIKCHALALLLTALLPLSPVIFTSASEKGAIRHDIL
jgi:hypothetical protein